MFKVYASLLVLLIFSNAAQAVTRSGYRDDLRTSADIRSEFQCGISSCQYTTKNLSAEELKAHIFDDLGWGTDFSYYLPQSEINLKTLVRIESSTSLKVRMTGQGCKVVDGELLRNEIDGIDCLELLMRTILSWDLTEDTVRRDKVKIKVEAHLIDIVKAGNFRVGLTGSVNATGAPNLSVPSIGSVDASGFNINFGNLTTAQLNMALEYGNENGFTETYISNESGNRANGSRFNINTKSAYQKVSCGNSGLSSTDCIQKGEVGLSITGRIAIKGEGEKRELTLRGLSFSYKDVSSEQGLLYSNPIERSEGLNFDLKFGEKKEYHSAVFNQKSEKKTSGFLRTGKTKKDATRQLFVYFSAILNGAENGLSSKDYTSEEISSMEDGDNSSLAEALEAISISTVDDKGAGLFYRGIHLKLDSKFMTKNVANFPLEIIYKRAGKVLKPVELKSFQSPRYIELGRLAKTGLSILNFGKKFNNKLNTEIIIRPDKRILKKYKGFKEYKASFDYEHNRNKIYNLEYSLK